MSSSRFATFIQNALCCDLHSYFLLTVRAEHVSESVEGREKEGKKYEDQDHAGRGVVLLSLAVSGLDL